jgi:signal transduction histidine kinase
MSAATADSAAPADADFHRSGTYYGAFAFGTVVLTCFGGFFFTHRFYQPAAYVPLIFVLGAVYATLGILSNDFIRRFPHRPLAAYYLAQCALLTALIFLSPSRGFFGMIVLPLASQSLFDLRGRYAALVVAYLFSANLAVWGFDFGWTAVGEAAFNYAAGFAFTIAFSLITRRSVFAHLQSEQLRRELEAANEKLRAAAAQTEELATTRERNRLAREIHDGVGHYLTVVKTQLDAAAALLPADPARAQATVEKAARLTAEALDDVRRSVGALRTDAAPAALDAALRELAAHGAPPAAVAVDGTPRQLPPAAAHALFRAAQEGLTNVRKHARATRADLRLDFRRPGTVRLEIADDGPGAPAGPAASPSGGYGLLGLRERVELLGGRIESGRRPAGGFLLAVEVPA